MATPSFNAPLTNPFRLSDVGSRSKPTFADIDGDGDLDAFVGNYDGNTLFYRNTGTAAAPDFAAPSPNPFGLSDVGYFSTPTFADIDGDGDLDAFVGGRNGNTLFYRNTGTASDPSFAAPSPNPFGLSNVGYLSSPTFVDIDGDGDLDAFVGNQSGNTLFYRNNGTASVPSFADPLTNPFGLSDVGNFSTPTFADIDGDDDLDAFIGGFAGRTLFYRNNGNAAAPSFATSSPNNPFGLSDVGYFSTPTFADIDGDGDLDAFVGNGAGNTLFFENATPRVSIAPSSTPSEARTTPNNGRFLLTLSDPAPAGGITVTYTVGGTATAGSDYTPLTGSVTLAAGATNAAIDVAPLLDNVVDPSETIVVTLTATPTSPYALGTTRTAVLRIADQVPLNFAAPVTNPFGLSNVGFVSLPTFADIDGDGDLDAFVGNFYGNTLFYRNNGTAATPSFDAPSTDPFGLSDVGAFSTPTFADIDGDGDLDAFVGNFDGNTLFYRNTGTAATPNFDAPSTDPFGLSDVGNFSSPTFADIDGDGDLDAFVGNFYGNTVFYRNTGTAATPSFATLSTDPFGLSDVGFVSKPIFADIDGDGDLDAFVGNRDGNTLFYRNTGTAAAPSFAAPSPNPFGLSDVGTYSNLTFADIDGDGDLDAFVGNRGGNTLFFENAPTLSVTAGSTAAEPSTPGSFTLTLSQAAPDGGITVSYSLSGTATNGTDYTVPLTTTIAAGQTTATVTVTPIADVLAEGNETVILTLVDQRGYTLGTTTTATITLLDTPNQSPTDLALSPATVNENVPIGTVVGNFSTTDPDTGNTFTYTLVDTANFPDNAAFTITGNQLQVTAALNFEDKSSYTIQVRTTDQDGLFYEEVVTVGIIDINEAPTAIALDNNTLTENAVAAVVGTLTVTDPDAGSINTFVVSDTRFEVVGGQLKLKSGISLDYETETSVSLDITATDQGGLSTTQNFVINVNDVVENTAPTDLALSPTTVNENVAVGTTVGTFSTTDAEGGIFTYTLVDIVNFPDNAAFTITDNQLRVANGLDFETKSSYTIQVRTTDQDGLFYEEVVTISITDIFENLAPTDLALSPSSVAENSAIGTVVGSFSTTDAEGGSFTYTLVDGASFPDNAAFTITGNQLKVNAAFNFEADNSYSVKVRTTDEGGLFYEEVVTIGITNVNEAPDAVNDSFLGNQTTPLVIPATTLLANDTDPDAATVLRVSAVSSAVGGSVVLSTNGTPTNFADDFVTFTPNTSFSGTASFVYTLSDGSLTDTATVSIAVGRTVNGSGNDDTIDGTPGNDIFTGGSGQDRLTGLAGNDRLDGGEGDDRLDGGADNDLLSGGNGQDLLLGGTGLDTLNGGSGDDRLEGGADNDTLNGDDNNDQLFGDAGNDILNGGNGGDRLLGGLGNDTLTGGGSNDTFILAAGSGTDTITDFVDNTDRIGLAAGLVFSQLTIRAGTGSNTGSTLITRTSTTEVLAILTGIQSNSITSNDFVTV